ncbi:MAG: hypothetical protein QOF51_2396 [Chloroflexota bacterium]|nr:hypothetical protein [Chloroflexota bacterium]
MSGAKTARGEDCAGHAGPYGITGGTPQYVNGAGQFPSFDDAAMLAVVARRTWMEGHVARCGVGAAAEVR